jgi:hypothetical protein
MASMFSTHRIQARGARVGDCLAVAAVGGFLVHACTVFFFPVFVSPNRS